MKKLTAEEFDNIPKKGWGRSSNAFQAIFTLKKDDAVVIEKKDWHSRSKTPSTICRYIEKKFPQVKYIYAALADGSGWAVKRVK